MGELPDLSREQASALLSARSYAEGVLYRLIGTMNHYPNERLIEAKLVEFIIRDDALRDRAIAWSKRSFARGGGAIPSPKRDDHFVRVEEEAERLLQQYG